MQKFFREPEELPAGFFEAIQPLARWALDAMREIYRLGYSNGKADSTLESKEICDYILKNDRRKKPPTGAAPVISLS